MLSESEGPERTGNPASATPASIAPERLEQIAIDACRLAAAIIGGSHERSAVSTKSTRTDIVTATDLAAEQAIRERIVSSAPGSIVLGEEGGHERAGDGPHGDVEWVVDPLDGTVNFSYRIPVTSVSVAAIVNGRPIAGAVVDVGTLESFSAHAGGGGRCGGNRIEVSGCHELGLALVATGYPYDTARRAEHGRAIADLVGRVRDIRAFGSAALELCWVAAGRLDGYVERDIKPWDHAAGALIAREAGATVELPCPENDGMIVAANPSLFPMLRAAVASRGGPDPS